MKRAAAHCENCGAKMVQYKHSLCRGLIHGLKTLAKACDIAGGAVSLEGLGLSNSDFTNFHKLKYWGLAAQFLEDGKKRSGLWEITQLGRQFLSGDARVPRQVWTYRGFPVGTDGDHVVADDVTAKDYRRAEDYAADARPQGVSA